MTPEPVFNPEMLTLARQAHEFTQEDLAERAEISQVRISRIEHGLVQPNDQEVDRLAAALEYPRDFFFQVGHNYAPPVRMHRKRASLSQKVLNRIHAEINIRTLQIRQLLQGATFDPELPLRHLDPEEYEGRIEDVARAVRSAWQVPRGPIVNIVRLMERAGIIIVPMRFGVPGFDAMTHLVPQLPPLVFINEESPMDRLRFTLAHELGHLVMHVFPTPTMEQEANRFAAEFLTPRAELEPQMQRVSLPILAALKAVWKVSMASLLEQAKRFGIVTDRQYVRLRTELSKLGYLKREPENLDVQREHPQLLFRIVDYYRNQLKFGVNELSAVIRDYPDRVRENFFNEPKPKLSLVIA